MRLILLFVFCAMLVAQSNGEAPIKGEEGLRIQIFLDQKCFGPGFLDGKPGNFTKHAVASYNQFKGRDPLAWSELLEEAKSEVKNLYAVGIVPSLARDFVDPDLPQKYEDVGGVELMAYRSYLEFMAERYHTSESFLIELNSKKKVDQLKPGDPLIVPNIEPFRIEKLGAGRTHKTDKKLSKHIVVIDTKTRQLFVYDSSHEEVPDPGAEVIATEEEGEKLGKIVAMFPITPGQEKFIHRGTWEMKTCVEFPTWRYDKQLLEEGVRSKEAIQVAHGPNNPVGVMWCGLSKAGIGIHGTSSPRTIGRSQSAGCYRLSNWDAARFPNYVRPGAKVIVR